MCRKSKKAIRPLLESELSLKKLRIGLNEMFALAVSNAPENETENFTAKKITPVYLALSEMLILLRRPK